ncbi:MAG: acyltransferase domain-containing protein [Acidobacteria bacterium]|nr:acyltransferase domain-containing protein [Acidobacteriota bacterium]
MESTSSRIASLSPERRALLEKRLRETAKPPAPEPLAVVGLACRFPGGLSSPAEFWDFVCRGGDAIGPVPRDRWDASVLGDDDASGAGLGGFLSDVDRFDARFFAISPREAAHLDPQQRLLLEVGWEAFEDAGLTRDALAGSDTGVFVGLHSHSSDYCWLQFASPASIDAFTGTGTAHNMVAGRLSYVLDLHGPALAVDTACSSSLVAVHLACQSLRAGDCAIALAAGVNVMLAPAFTVAATKMQMLSPDGHCHAFDAAGNGFVRGEGCGAVVLRRLSDAIRSGDRILAVVSGSAINQDGHTNGVTAPNGLAQRSVIRAALRNAGVDPAHVGLIEAHGTGTRLGDPIEAEALADVFGPARDGAETVWLGSAKANVGHLEGAAGVAGFIKAVLSVHHGSVPPLGLFRSLNPLIQIEGSRLAVPTEPRPWNPAAARRLAGVSAFGWSGTNAHVVVEQAPPLESQPSQASPPGRLLLLPVSGHTREAAAAAAGAMADYLESPAARALPFDAICGTAAHRRTHHACRLAVAAACHGDAAALLKGYARGEEVRGAVAGEVATARNAGPVFVFSGQGSQWVGMGRELAEAEPVFRQTIEACDRALRPWTDWSLLDLLQRSVDDALWARVDVIQPALFAVQAALAALWRSYGVVPSAVVGHSMGEVAAAYVAGALDLDTAARLIAVRSRLLRRISGRGAMALLELSLDQARAAIAGHEEAVSIAASNSRGSTVISGEPAAVAEIVAALSAQDVFCRLVKVDVASHSPQVDPLAAQLTQELDGFQPGAGMVPIYSTVKAARTAGTDLDAAYWAANLRRPVLLSATTARLLEDGFTDFVEVSPHPILTTDIGRDLGESGSDGMAAGSQRRDEPERRSFLESLAAVFARGHLVDWRAVVPEPRPPVDLPRYPWQRERFWLDESELSAGSAWQSARGVAPDGGTKVDGWLYQFAWKPSPESASPAASPGRWLLVGDGTALVGAAEAAVRADGGDSVRLSEALERSLRRTADEPEAERDLERWLRGLGQLGGVAAFCTDRVESGDAATVEQMEQAAAAHSLLVVRVVRAMAACGLSVPLWVVTRGAQAAGAVPPAGSLPQAAVWGIGRVVAEEHPDCWGGLIDADPDASDDEAAAAVVRHCRAPEGERQVAFRSRIRFAARFTPAPAGRSGWPFRCHPDSSYLVTGGLGGVGVEVASWLVDRGARWLVLAGRTPLPPRDAWDTLDPDSPSGQKVAAVRRLEARGARVATPAIDIGDEAQCHALLDGALAPGWPALRGFVHAATVTDDHLVTEVDATGLLSILRPKLRGAWLLHQARSRAVFDFAIWFSSLGSLIGQSGQATYAAANALVDALAALDGAMHGGSTGINWGGWRDLGLAARSAGARRTIANLASEGIGGFSGPDGIAALERIIERRLAQAAVAPVDPVRFRESHWYRADPRYFAFASDDDAPVADSRREAGPGARDVVLALPQAERAAALAALVRDELAHVLGLPAGQIDFQRPMGTLGLESLLALELRNRLERRLSLTLAATVVWKHPTVNALAAHLGERLSGGAAPQPPPPAEPPARLPKGAPALGEELLALSDEEAMRALQGRPRG